MSSTAAPKKTTSSKSACPACTRLTGTDLLSWKDPIASAKVSGSILGGLLVYRYTDFVSWFFYLSAIVLAASALAEYVGKVATGEGFISRFKPAQTTHIGDFLEAHAQIFAKAFKDAEIKLQNLFTSVNIETTLKAAIVSYVLYQLTSFLSVWTIAFTTTVLAFTLPAAYASNKELVDSSVKQYSELAKSKSLSAYKSIKTQAEPHLKKVEEKIAPLTDFIKSKIPVRTAGSTVESTPSVEKPPKATEIKETVSSAAADIKDTVSKTANKAEAESEPLLN